MRNIGELRKKHEKEMEEALREQKIAEKLPPGPYRIVFQNGGSVWACYDGKTWEETVVFIRQFDLKPVEARRFGCVEVCPPDEFSEKAADIKSVWSVENGVCIKQVRGKGYGYAEVTFWPIHEVPKLKIIVRLDGDLPYNKMTTSSPRFTKYGDVKSTVRRDVTLSPYEISFWAPDYGVNKISVVSGADGLLEALKCRLSSRST